LSIKITRCTNKKQDKTTQSDDNDLKKPKKLENPKISNYAKVFLKTFNNSATR
jgi:hypothetical protein